MENNSKVRQVLNNQSELIQNIKEQKNRAIRQDEVIKLFIKLRFGLKGNPFVEIKGKHDRNIYYADVNSLGNDILIIKMVYNNFNKLSEVEIIKKNLINGVKVSKIDLIDGLTERKLSRLPNNINQVIKQLNKV